MGIWVTEQNVNVTFIYITKKKTGGKRVKVKLVGFLPIIISMPFA